MLSRIVWKWGPIRSDHSCGPKKGDCDVNGKWPCCSPGGWCGASHAHCQWKGSYDFRGKFVLIPVA